MLQAFLYFVIQNMWEYMGEDPEFNHAYNNCMARRIGLAMVEILSGLDRILMKVLDCDSHNHTFRGYLDDLSLSHWTSILELYQVTNYLIAVSTLHP